MVKFIKSNIMKHNNNGMTLVEVIIGLSIFSVALIILSTGFITGGRVLADANEHSIQSNQMKIELADQKGLLEDASVTIEVNHKDIVLKGNYQVVSGEDEHLDFIVYQTINQQGE